MADRVSDCYLRNCMNTWDKGRPRIGVPGLSTAKNGLLLTNKMFSIKEHNKNIYRLDAVSP